MVQTPSKDYIIELLSKHNCEADLDALSDYILALTENGVEKAEDFTEHLEVFLHDSTGGFVDELIRYLEHFPKKNNNEVVDDEVVEVDYEESSETEGIVSKIPHQPQRPLREYSPERRPDQSKITTTDKKPCTNFSKYGNCRFGDNCRFSHLNPIQSRRKNVSSRVKLSNLPPSRLDPSSLTEIMSKYGSVINVTVYPEKCEALVHFASGDEASAAVNGAIEDFESDEVVIELEIIRPTLIPSSKFPVNQRGFRPSHQQPAMTSTADNEKLQSLIGLQKQQQSLLETNLSTQQSLLTHLQSPTISSEDRLELLGALKKVQESVMNVQEMLKKTTELVTETATGSGYVKKNQFTNQRPIMRRSQMPSFRPSQMSTFRPSYNATYTPGTARPTSSHTLDLRPTTLKLSSLKSTPFTDIHSLQRHFAPFGPIQSLIITDEGQSALIKYQKHFDAQKAFEKVRKEFEGVEGVEFEFIKPQ